jgi:hypothetical protein
MPELSFPRRIARPMTNQETRSCPAHRAWVRRHHCCVGSCYQTPIECAHVRKGGDGGMGLKPTDRWVISLCAHHHSEQHRIGEAAFEARYGINLIALASEFARRSPHWAALNRM